MTPIMNPLTLAEQWKKKCFKFAAQSDDNLVPVISKVIDTLALYLKDSAHLRLQPALKTLEYERSTYLSEEIFNVPSIRTMMYGIIQSVHGLLLAKTAFNYSNSFEAKAILAIVGEWRMKCCALSNQSDDILLRVFEKVLDAIAVILKDAEQSRIQTALKALNYELSLGKFEENADEPSLRSLMYGVIECVHGCLLDMTALKNSIPSEETHHHKVADEHRMNVDKQLKKEKSIDDEMVQHSDDAFSTIPDFTIPPVVPKEEKSIDPPPVIPEDNMAPVFTLSPKKEPKEEVDNAEKMNSIGNDKRFDDEEMMNGDMDVGLDNEIDDFPLDEGNEEELEVNNNNLALAVSAEKRSSRKMFKPIKFGNEDEDSDGEEGSSMKKTRSQTNGKKRRPVNEDNESEPDNKKRRVSKRSDMEMECPECTFRSNSVTGWITHLRSKHSTTPALAGVALRCDCGNVGFSSEHIYSCEVANFTVIRKRNGPIRRLEDEKVTPQCVLCETYPKSACGYVQHLRFQHGETTLAENGIQLNCACGFVYTDRGRKHDKKCDGREYTLHKIDEE